MKVYLVWLGCGEDKCVVRVCGSQAAGLTFLLNWYQRDRESNVVLDTGETRAVDWEGAMRLECNIGNGPLGSGPRWAGIGSVEEWEVDAA